MQYDKTNDTTQMKYKDLYTSYLIFKDNKEHVLLEEEFVILSMSVNHVLSVLVDKDGKRYLCSEYGIYYDPDGTIITPIANNTLAKLLNGEVKFKEVWKHNAMELECRPEIEELNVYAYNAVDCQEDYLDNFGDAYLPKDKIFNYSERYIDYLSKC